VLREAGYTEEQIEQFLEENQVAAEEFGNQLLTAFDRDAEAGRPPTGRNTITERDQA